MDPNTGERVTVFPEKKEEEKKEEKTSKLSLPKDVNWSVVGIVAGAIVLLFAIYKLVMYLKNRKRDEISAPPVSKPN